jgi:hypothetical protein
MAMRDYGMGEFAQQLSDSNEGLWPQEKPLYDPGNFCQLQKPSKDTFDAGGNKVVVRTSSTEGMWETQAECCQALWCQGRCDAFAQSSCDKAEHYSCKSKCASSPNAAPRAPTSLGHQHHCLTQKGAQYCGEDCAQAKKDGFGCWDEKTCEEVPADDAVRGRRYFAAMEKCCVEYAALNGESKTGTRCAEDPVSQRRVTDYRKQEPAGPGGYEDRGEFPPEQPASLAKPAPRAPSPRQRSGDRHSQARPAPHQVLRRHA